jgi:hypothetical protein
VYDFFPGDLNDQSDYSNGYFGIHWVDSKIGRLLAGSGSKAIPLKAENHKMDMGGLKFSNPEDLANNFHVPKMTLNYVVTNAFIKTDPETGLPDLFADNAANPVTWSDFAMNRTSYNTQEKLETLRFKVLNYFQTRYAKYIKGISSLLNID